MAAWVLPIFVAVLVAGCNATVPPATDPPIPSPEASAVVTAPPTPDTGDTFPPLAMIRALNPGISLRAAAGVSAERLGSLAEGSRSLVLDGPVEADGLRWYWLSGPGLPPASGCITPIPTEPLGCPIWLGWAATGPGDDWFALDPTDCPNPSSDLYGFARLGDYEALSCASGQQLELVGWLLPYATTPEYAECPTEGRATAPDWLWCNDRWWEALYANPEEAIFIGLYVDPASGLVLPHDGRWVAITGHADDPRAAGCLDSVPIGWPISEGAVVLECRAHFVVTSVRDAPTPP